MMGLRFFENFEQAGEQDEGAAIDCIDGNGLQRWWRPSEINEGCAFIALKRMTIAEGPTLSSGMTIAAKSKMAVNDYVVEP